jgi:RNA recognition motif-containing protein
MRDTDGASLGFGFVCFKEPEATQRALAELNGKEGLYVRQALKKAQRLAEIQKVTERYKASMLRYNLYFKNVPADSTEAELTEYFAEYGEIKSLKLMRKPAEPAEVPSEEVKVGESLDFGFVSFATTESAARARHESKAKPFKGVTLFVCQFEPKSLRQAHILEARDKLQLEQYKKLLRPTVPEQPAGVSATNILCDAALQSSQGFTLSHLI